jgi:hypothetical protein
MRIPSTSAVVFLSFLVASPALAEEPIVVSGVELWKVHQFLQGKSGKNRNAVFFMDARIYELHQFQSENAERHGSRFHRHPVCRPTELDPRVLPEKPDEDLSACDHRAFSGIGTGSNEKVQEGTGIGVRRAHQTGSPSFAGRSMPLGKGSSLSRMSVVSAVIQARPVMRGTIPPLLLSE